MSEAPTVPVVPFTIVVPTVYGPMMVNRHDINQTNALFKTGHAIDHGEIVMLSRVLQLLGTDLTVLDIGANFGTYTIGLARLVGPNGKVHAFEPQRLIFNLLVGSVALNSLTNVYCHNVALGNEQGKVEIPQYDYNRPLNFGSIEFTGRQSETLSQERLHDAAKVEYVPLTTIDRFEFPRVNLMKIDAEGMETSIILGSTETIRRCRPVLYVEYLKGNADALRDTIQKLEYAVHPMGMNFLCIPAEMRDRIRITTSPTP